jgi:hypothetical protein
VSWIIDNKEWIFSGVGVSLLNVVVAIFFRRDKTLHPRKSQGKTSGNFSPQIDAQGNVNLIFSGISHAGTVQTSAAVGELSQSEATMIGTSQSDKNQQEHDIAHNILNSLVKGYSQRILSATSEAERKTQKELFYNQMRTSKMYNEMPKEIFELWINQCLIAGSYLTLVEFINSTQNDSFLNSLDNETGKRYMEWLFSKALTQPK